jgi:hypothetical protein
MAGIEYHPPLGTPPEAQKICIPKEGGKWWRWRESNIIPLGDLARSSKNLPPKRGRQMVEMAGIEYHPPLGTPSERSESQHAPKNKCPPGRGANGGDGGNRTRVRKNRPTEIYERSRSKGVTAGISSGTNRLRSAAMSFARLAASGAALRVCLARACPWRRSGQVDAALLRGPDCQLLTLGGERHGSVGSAIGT